MGVSQTLMERLGAEYAAMSRLDWEALFADVAPDFELVTPERSPSPGVWRGAGRARDMFRDFFVPFEEISVEPQEFFERDDLVVVFYTQQSRPAGSVATVNNISAHVWTMRDGKPARLQIFPSR